MIKATAIIIIIINIVIRAEGAQHTTSQGTLEGGWKC
jgi:hypothetical protein